jgi:cyclophilin family peptidyl-prolyl cis-trans isomerase
MKTIAGSRTCDPLVIALSVLVLGLGPLPPSIRAQTEPGWVQLDPERTLYINVPDGRVVVELSQDFAPNHVEQMRLLAREGHYEGYTFMRVIEGFLAQAGEPTWEKEIRTGREALPAEFESEWSEAFAYTPIAPPNEFGEEAGLINGFPVRRSAADGRVWITRCPGILGFARAGEPDTGRSSFWITLQDSRFNDRNDTAFGRVVWGMEHISRLPRTDGFDFEAGTPVVSVQVAADLPREEQLQLEVPDTSHPTFLERVETRRQGSAEWHVQRPLHYDLCHFVPSAREVGSG